MDGHSTEGFGFSGKSIREMANFTSIPIDIHMMTLTPERDLNDFVNLKINSFTFHVETTKDVIKVIRKIKQYGIHAGIAVSPEIAIDSIKKCIPYCDEAIIMAVKPGCGGSRFNDRALIKVRQLAKLASKRRPNLVIAVDGGVHINEARKAVENGANKIIVGTGVYCCGDAKEFGSIFKGLDGGKL